MKPLRTITALAALATLAVPAAASAHGSVYESLAKVVPQGGDPAMPVTETRYVVTNHGFTFALKESNSAPDEGMIDYKVLPSAYRNRPAFTKTMLLAEGDTGAQPHATCRDVTALTDESAVLAWQGTDPFYNYVPFQKEAAGLEDDPAKWIPIVQQLTGVDLATVADPAAACVGLGGNYTAADAPATSAASMASGTVEHETAPLNAEIATLKTAATGAAGAMTALQGLLDVAKAEIAKLTAAAAPMKVALPSASAKGKTLVKQGAKVTVTGPAGASIKVELKVSESQARKLKLKSSMLASATATIGADGAISVALAPRKSTRKALNNLKRSVAMTVTALSGDRFAATTGTVSR